MMRNAFNGAMTAVVAAITALAVIVLAQPSNAPASQGKAFLDTTGTYSGLDAANRMNGALDALLTCNKGNAPPTNAIGEAAKAGQCWLDDSSAGMLVKRRYSGSGWVVEGVIDVTNGQWVPPVGGGAGSVNSAAITNLCASPQAVQTVNGTASISGFGADCVTGTKKTLIFSASLTLTYNVTSLILPGGANIQIGAGDVAEAVALGSGNWRVTAVTKADGSAVKNPALPLGTVLFGDFATIPPKTQIGFGQAISRASYPDYLAAVTRTQAGTRTSGGSSLTGLANTRGFGVGMPVEGVGIQAGTTITAVTTSTISISANAISNGTGDITVFVTGYGFGGDSTTVGVKQCTGTVIAGLDLGAARLSNAGAFNQFQGAKEVALTVDQMPTHNHGYTDLGHTHLVNAKRPTTAQAGTSQSVAGVAEDPVNTSNNTVNITINNSGGGAAHPNVQPTVTAECVVVVLP